MMMKLHTLPHMGPSPYPCLPDIEINIAGVTKLLKEINPYKATGPDCIPAKVLKEMDEELSLSLAYIYCFPATQKDTTRLEEGLNNPLI